ncbi:MAG: thioredoxin domain-containing protein [Myxococcota bacterium]|nr:thioredoxin domain-containing protein [Myxococcota bacterium]
MNIRFILLTTLSGLGVFISERLIKTHIDTTILQRGDTGVCGANDAFSCADLATTWLAEIGGIPIATIGFAFYIAAFILISVERFQPSLIKGTPDVFILGGVLAVIYSIFLGVMGKVETGKWCPLCIGLYGINLGLLLTAYLSHPNGRSGAFKSSLRAPAQPAFWAAVLVLAFAIPTSHWLTSKRKQSAQRLKAIQKVDTTVVDTSVTPGQSPARGRLDAPIAIIEFSDFECPYCKRLADSLKEASERAPKLIRYYFKHFPMDNACNRDMKRPMHENACTAARAMECAHEGGKGWALHDAMFANQNKLAPNTIKALAKDIGLDIERFTACMENQRSIEIVKSDIEAAIRLKVQGTPTWYMNGVRMVGFKTPDEIISLARRLVKDEAQKNGGDQPSSTPKP